MPRHRRLDDGGHDGAQWHRVRHPRRRPRRPLVHGGGERPARPLLPRLRARGREPRHRRQRHRRDHRARRLRHGGLALRRPLRGRGRSRRRHQDHGGDGRDLPGRASPLPHADARRAGHARRHRRVPSGGDRDCAAHQYRHRGQDSRHGPDRRRRGAGTAGLLRSGARRPRRGAGTPDAPDRPFANRRGARLSSLLDHGSATHHTRQGGEATSHGEQHDPGGQRRDHAALRRHARVRSVQLLPDHPRGRVGSLRVAPHARAQGALQPRLVPDPRQRPDHPRRHGPRPAARRHARTSRGAS